MSGKLFFAIRLTLLFTIPVSGVFSQTQQGGPRGPMLGFAFDRRASALRPILGMPGAAYFSSILDAGFPIALAAVSPRQDYALAVSAADSQPYIIKLSAVPLQVSLLNGVAAAPGTIILSPAGGSAVFVESSRTKLQVITGLPDSPSTGDPIDLSIFQGTLQSIGVSDDGAVLASISAPDGSSMLYVLSGTFSPQFVGIAGQASAISFLPSAGDAVVADRANNQILLLKDVAGSAALTIIGANNDGITDPASVALSRTGRFVFIANAAGRSLVRIDLTGAMAATSFPCACTPSGLSKLAGDSVFQLNGLSSQPTWVFDGDTADPRMVFIPAPVAAVAAKGVAQ